MQPGVIIRKLTGRVSRNIVFWLLATFYLHSSRSTFYPYFPALLAVVFVSFGIPGYINNLWLIPKYLVKGKYIPYIILFVLLLALTATGSYYETHWVNDHIKGLNYMDSVKDVALPYHAFPSMLMFSMLAFGKFMGDAIRNQHRLDDLEKEKLKSELESLRSQINPHFLFNALNTIYGMARRTDEETAGAIIKLSDILRHGLYECDDNEIELEKEVLFIRQYIEFAKLRLYDKDKIRLQVEGDIGRQKIAPLLLMPFIENAIKHGMGDNSTEPDIDVNITLSQNTLYFKCTNSNLGKPKRREFLSSTGGIGLRNVRRRLQLLYAGRHSLDVKDDAGAFSIELNLQLR